jgi:hypothetical protein
MVRAAAANSNNGSDRHVTEDYIRIHQQLLSRSSTQAAA